MKPVITITSYRPAVCHDRATTVLLLVRLEVSRPKPVKRWGFWAQGYQKPALNLGLAIDRSGSMGDIPMARAKEAAVHLFERLGPTDKISAVTFDDRVDVLAGSKEKRFQFGLAYRLKKVEARGGTNLHEGWLEACVQVERGFEEKRLSRVLLLSDGQANEGLTDQKRIVEQVNQWQRRGITTSTVGIGLEYNEDLLSEMARAGGGNFYHIEDSKDIEPSFQVELLGLSRTYGRSVTLGIEALGGVEILRVVNQLATDEGGKNLRLSDLKHGCPTSIVLELLVPPQTTEQNLCRFNLAWTEVDSGIRRELAQEFRLPIVSFGQLSEFPECPEVRQEFAIQLAGQKLSEAAALLKENSRDEAGEIIRAGLALLAEVDPNSEIQALKNQLQELLQQLKRGQWASVRKQATYSSSSLSLGSPSLSTALREWVALTPEERQGMDIQQFFEKYGS